MLELTKTSDDMHKVPSILVWGPSGSGKTTLAATLPVKDDERLLYVAVDPGHMAINHRNFVMAMPKTWEEVQWLFGVHLVNHKDSYDWVVIDGLDELGKICLSEEMGKTANGMKAYGEMAEKVEMMTKFVRDLGMGTLFITHDEEKDAESDCRYGPRFPGRQLTGTLVDLFDEVLCLRMKVKMTDAGTETVRAIQTGPEADPRYKTKDRSGNLEQWEEPDLSKIIEKIYGGKKDGTSGKAKLSK